MFALVDCNNFYCSCERVFNPALRDKPVVVLSNNDGCIIARSNEAKALGIKMGEPFFKIRQTLEEQKVAVFSSNYALYGDMSHRVMSLLSEFTPDITIYSIDEAFLQLPIAEHDPTFSIEEYGKKIVRTVTKGTGIPVTIGIAPTKTLAKIASHFGKQYAGYKNVCLIDTEEKRAKALQLTPIHEVWGIGRRLSPQLAYYGIRTAWDLTQKSEQWVRRNFSVTLARTWKELQGDSCIDIEELPHSKSICTSRSFPEKGISELPLLEEAVANFAASCSRKLKQQRTACYGMTIFAYTSRFPTSGHPYQLSQTCSFSVATSDRQEIVSRAVEVLRQHWPDDITPFIKKAGVIAWGIIPDTAIQAQLFDPIDRGKQMALSKAIEEINRKNGHNMVRIAVQGYDKRWHLKCERISKQYTTDIDDIIEIKL
jgi:DNA polymerase V